MDYAKRVMSGTWGSVWLDDELISEVTGFQAKFNSNKEKIGICGRMINDHKIMSMDGTGSLTMHKVNSRMILLLSDAMKNGKDLRFTLVGKLADPDSYGTERISLSGVSFDDLTLADWQHGQTSKITAAFTFSDYAPLDTVQPQN